MPASYTHDECLTAPSPFTINPNPASVYIATTTMIMGGCIKNPTMEIIAVTFPSPSHTPRVLTASFPSQRNPQSEAAAQHCTLTAQQCPPHHHPLPANANRNGHLPTRHNQCHSSKLAGLPAQTSKWCHSSTLPSHCGTTPAAPSFSFYACKSKWTSPRKR